MLNFDVPSSYSIKTFLRSVAVHLKLAEPIQNFPKPFEFHEIDLILDVGANVGQYAINCRKQGFKGTIVSFEPLPDAHKILKRKAGNDEHWIVHPRSAIGSTSKEINLNIAGNSYSSSVLEMLERHIQVAPESKYISSVKTKLETIDSILPIYLSNSNRILLKIDTQGYEAEVIKGAIESLSKISLIQIELSIVPLYLDQELYNYFFDFMRNNSFKLWDVIPGFRDDSTGQLLQFDAFFYRDNQM